MKKNLYNIMNEACGQELESLLENVECEIPEGISAENIAEKVAKKRKQAKVKARTLWLRYGAVAACLALIIAAVPTVNYFISDSASGNKAQEIITANTEMGLEPIPAIGYLQSISYTYFLPLEDGTCLTKKVTHKLNNGKLDKTWKDHLAIFFEHCGLDVTVTNWETTTTGASTQTSPDGKLVTHTFGTTTLYLYLEGEPALDDHTLKCLVNTIDSITYARYIKLYYNSEPVAIEGKCPEEGFVNFKLDTAE